MSTGPKILHIFVDLETYDTKPTARLRQIGFCGVTADGSVMITKEITLDVDGTYFDRELTTGKDTLSWWNLSENAEANAVINGAAKVPYWQGIILAQRWLQHEANQYGKGNVCL